MDRHAFAKGGYTFWKARACFLAQTPNPLSQGAARGAIKTLKFVGSQFLRELNGRELCREKNLV
jgi:hypothetical protein